MTAEQFAYRFNPTLVRLRKAVDGRYAVILRRFQSHAGSIEDGLGIPDAFHLRCFNPTLVRLRPLHGRAPRGNFTLVSIPRWFD